MKRVFILSLVIALSSFLPANAATIKTSKPLIDLPYTKSDQISDVALTPVSILITGTTESQSLTWLTGSLSGLSDGFIASYSSIGAPMWNLRLGSTTDEITTSVAVDIDGSIWVLGASSSQVTSTQSAPLPKVLNPDNVIIEPVQPSSTPMKRIKIWQISNTGNLLNSYEFISESVINPKKLLIFNTTLIILGNLYEKAITTGFYLSATKTGTFLPVIKVGVKNTQINDAIVNFDGSIIAVGSSGELLLKVKPLSKADAVTLKFSSVGVLQQVARATLKNTVRSWSSLDIGLLQAGKVTYSNKLEAAITKFSALSKPVWNVRYPAKSTALATVRQNSWVTFVSTGVIKGVPAWKPKLPTPVLLELGKKGEVISLSTLDSPVVAITSNNEIGTVAITDSGVSFGLVVFD